MPTTTTEDALIEAIETMLLYATPATKAAAESTASARAAVERAKVDTYEAAFVGEDPRGLPRNAAGAKLDAGKAPMRLIMHSMPRALFAVAEVARYGAEKYSVNGWLQVPDGINRYTDAMFRHALLEGIELRDKESSLLHAAQAAWNSLARLELMLRVTDKSLDEAILMLAATRSMLKE